MPTKTQIEITLKNVKLHPDMSQETACFSATIYVNGKRAGTVRNEGRGGSHFYDWLDQSLADQAEAWAKAQDHQFNFEILDQAIDKLLTEWETDKQYRRWCRKETVFRLKGDKDGSWRTIKHPYNSDVQTFLDNKYGDKIEEVLNKRFS